MFFAVSAYAHASAMQFVDRVANRNLYIGIAVGAGGDDNFTGVSAISPGVSISSSSSNAFFGLEAGFEAPVIGDHQWLGFRVNVNRHSEAKLTTRAGLNSNEIKNSIMTVPITAYYKHFFNHSAFSIMGGAGITFISSQWDFDTYISGSGLTSTSFTESRISPHLVFGAEHRFSPLFGLGLDFRYTFNAEMQRDYLLQELKRDVSFVGTLTARFYF